MYRAHKRASERVAGRERATHMQFADDEHTEEESNPHKRELRTADTKPNVRAQVLVEVEVGEEVWVKQPLNVLAITCCKKWRLR